jgi:hypothetical protein
MAIVTKKAAAPPPASRQSADILAIAGTLFTTLHFLHNLLTDPIEQCVLDTNAGKQVS